jgi:hypothetical protein
MKIQLSSFGLFKKSKSRKLDISVIFAPVDYLAFYPSTSDKSKGVSDDAR